MKKATYLFFVLAMLVFLAGCQAEPAAEMTASLSELVGLVEMQKSGGEFIKASADTVLEVNGQVRTGEDGRVRLDLSSGTILRLAPSSLFTLTSNDPVEGGLYTKIKLQAGRIFIILNGGQADVETPSGLASVRGSYLSVSVEAGQIVITCLEGTCTTEGTDGEKISIPPGYKITITLNKDTNQWSSPQLGLMTPEDFQDWLDNNPEAQELVDQGIATLTALPPTEEPTEAPTSTPTEAATEAPTATAEANAGGSCSQPEEPISGSALEKIGLVNFAWSEQANAQYYVLTFLNSDGSRSRIRTETNNAAFYIEVLPAGGNYEWFVTAYGSDGGEICSSTSASFSKPQADPTQRPVEKPSVEEPNSCSTASTVETCNPNSACYNYSWYCDECIVEGVDMCQQQTCSAADVCDPYSYCYDPNAVCP